MGTVTDNLQNIQAFEFNATLVNNTDAIIENSINNLNSGTDGVWFMVTTLLLFVFLAWVFTREEFPYKLDFARSMLVSSGWCLLISVAGVIFTLSQTILPIIWFSTIFFLSGLMVYNRSEKGR